MDEKELDMSNEELQDWKPFMASISLDLLALDRDMAYDELEELMSDYNNVEINVWEGE